MSGRVRDLTEQRQVDRGQVAIAIGLHEEVEGGLPVAARGGLAPAFEARSAGGLAHRSSLGPAGSDRLRRLTEP